MEELEEQRLIRQYLLGTLGEKEQEQIEERVLTDPQYKDKVLMLEGELVEDYAAGSLSQSEREKFVKHFLSTPGQVEKLRITRALYEYATADKGTAPALPVSESDWLSPQKRWLTLLPGRRPSVAVLAGLVICVIVIGTVFYLVKGPWQAGRQADQRAVLEQEVAQFNNQQDPQTGLPANSNLTASQLLPVKLTSNLERASGEMARISVPAGAQLVQMQLGLTSKPAQSYQVTLSTITGDEIFTYESLRPRIADGTPIVILNVPVKVLTRGDYLLKLKEATGNPARVFEYPFRVAN